MQQYFAGLGRGLEPGRHVEEPRAIKSGRTITRGLFFRFGLRHYYLAVVW